MPRGLAQGTQNLIAAAAAILARIQPATVRGVCYQLFNHKLIPDMSRNSTQKMSRILVQARERDIIPWAWIVDETRPVELVSSWSDPERYMQAVIRSYRRDRWADQPERVMVVSEKGTVGGVIRPITEQYGVPFLVCHGFGSATALHDLADRSVSDPRPLVILYVGDHDPSGRYMSDFDLAERLDRYDGLATIERVAVTEEQMEDYDLLTFPAHEKKTDARHPWFVNHYGQTCCELDAHNPNDLRQLVEDAILDHLDWDLWDRAEEIQEVEMTSIEDFIRSWPGVASA